MDRAIYTAMGAASAALNQQAVTSNNLANVSTPGFRGQLAMFRAVPVEGPSMDTRTLVTASTPGNDFTAGPIQMTDRPLDVALGQDSWLAVQLPDGQEVYTRNGSIQVDQAGQLRIQGLELVGESGPMTVPTDALLTIGSNGTVSSLGVGDNPSAIAPVGRIKMVNVPPGELEHRDDGFFQLTATARAARGPVLAADPSINLVPGAIEGSNVSPVQALASMITNARSFEMQMKVISDVNENARSANQLLSLS